MKQILYVLSLAILLSLTYTSCKKDSLEGMRQDEVDTLDKYVKDNKLADKRDVSGIYIFDEMKGTGDTIKSGYRVMMYFKITLLDGTEINTRGFSTDDGQGRNYEEYTFYVDSNDPIISDQYVQKIAGMHLGLKKMQVGGKAKFIIPSELAFKAVDNLAIGIPRFSTLLVNVYARKGDAPDLPITK